LGDGAPLDFAAATAGVAVTALGSTRGVGAAIAEGSLRAVGVGVVGAAESSTAIGARNDASSESVMNEAAFAGQR